MVIDFIHLVIVFEAIKELLGNSVEQSNMAKILIIIYFFLIIVLVILLQEFIGIRDSNQ